MSTKHGGLGGQGLGALFGGNAHVAAGAAVPEKDRVQELAVADIRANRYQPRKDFDEAALEDLKASVEAYGVLQPVIVRRLPASEGEGQYELIAGERRLRAAKLAGLAKVPAIVREYSDAETSEIALIENLQREDLNPMEEARAYQSLIGSFGLTQDEISKKVGRSRSHIANFLRLQKLDEKVQDYVASGTLSMGQARPLVALESHELQRKAADYIQEHELTARGCEALVRKLAEDPTLLDAAEGENGGAQTATPAEDGTPELRATMDRLTEYFGTQVKIKRGKKKGKIEIDYYGDEDLERILELLHGGAGSTAASDAAASKGSMSPEEAEAEKQRKIEELRKFSTQGFTV